MRRLIEPSHLDLCCLQKPIIIACDSERVKRAKYTALGKMCDPSRGPTKKQKKTFSTENGAIRYQKGLYKINMILQFTGDF